MVQMGKDACCANRDLSSDPQHAHVLKMSSIAALSIIPTMDVGGVRKMLGLAGQLA